MYDIAAKYEETKKQQTDLLFGLIHVGPKLLKQFISSTKTDLLQLRVLCQEALQKSDYLGLVEPAFRLIHTAKGNAALFDLTLYKGYAIALEDELDKVRQNKSLASAGWVEHMLGKVGDIEDSLEETDSLLDEMIFVQQPNKQGLSATQALLTSVRILMTKLSRESGKQVTLRSEGFDLSAVSETLCEPISELVTQMVSNAVLHGIESSEQRQAVGKFPVGMICLQTLIADGTACIRIQDDGAGPDFERIKQLACERGVCEQQQLDKMSNTELAELVFLSGLSTIQVPTDAAGRGVGMDMVRQSVKENGGDFVFRFAVGHGCQFDIIFPLETN